MNGKYRVEQMRQTDTLEGNIVDGADARDALAGLASWSLARWMADGEGFTVHRLVQEITRQRHRDNEKAMRLMRRSPC
jgi:hypothetical protein